MNDRNIVINGCFSKSGKEILHEKFIPNDVKNIIINNTNFLPCDVNFKVRTKYFLGGYKSLRICHICGNDINDNWKNPYTDFKVTCSKKCAGILAYSIGDEKRQKTNNILYSGSSPFHSKYIQDKVKKTHKKIYGVSNVSQSDIIKNKIRIKINNRLNENWVKFKTNIVFAKSEWKLKSPKELSNEYNIDVSAIYNKAKEYGFDVKYKHKSGSSYETLIINKIKEFYDGEIIQSDRIQIHPLELDIYIPEKKLAIEICGLYWHSEEYKSKYYHQNKLNKSNEKGVHLITLFEDEIINSLDVIINKIKYLVGCNNNRIYARNTEIGSVSNEQRKYILSTNHIQGTAGGHNIGLYYNNKLVSIGVFKKRSDIEYELVRFCSSCSVIGGFSKIIKSFNRQFPLVNKLISFADLRIVSSINNVYESNGWREVYRLRPDYSFIKQQTRLHKFRLRSLDNRNKDYLKEGYLKIWDCGKIKYVLDI